MRSIYHRGGVQYNAGELTPGASASVTAIEQSGKGPMIVFDKAK